jgi:endonuclease G, mitochondrial
MKHFILITMLVLGHITCVSQVKIEHQSFTATWDTTLRYPTLVKWWLTKSKLECPGKKLERKDRFAPDPVLPVNTNISDDYKGSGLDRGHMCPAADNLCDPIAAIECFYFSNMSPQYHSLNAGDWKRLEVLSRDLSLANDSVLIWCGSLGSIKKIGRVSVPEWCWKAVFVKKTNTLTCYKFKNSAEKPKGLEAWVVTKEELEKLTGLTFNP